MLLSLIFSEADGIYPVSWKSLSGCFSLHILDCQRSDQTTCADPHGSFVSVKYILELTATSFLGLPSSYHSSSKPFQSIEDSLIFIYLRLTGTSFPSQRLLNLESD